MSALPSFEDIRVLVTYALAHPYPFLARGTVVTTALLIGVAVLSVLPGRSRSVRRIAPSVAAILVYFGLGSFALASEIILRFHSSAPHETEVQFVSGMSHLTLAVVGLALLYRHLGHHTRVEWLWAHTVAVAYWTFIVTVFTPEWFTFKDQQETLRVAALVIFAVAAGINALLWTHAGRSRVAPASTPAGVVRRDRIRPEGGLR